MSDYKVGDKFVIEIAENIKGYGNDPEQEDPLNLPVLHRIKGFNSLVFDDFGLDKLQQIADFDGKMYTEDELEDDRAASYHEGLEDAWEAIKKIVLNPSRGGLTGQELREIFGLDTPYAILSIISVTEALEKISNYEKKKEKMFCVGDVIQSKDNPEVIAVVTFAESGGIFDAIKISESDKWGPKYDLFFKRPMSFWEKTGEHFDLDELFQVNQKAGRR